MHLLLMFTAFALMVPWSLRLARLHGRVFKWRRPFESCVSILMLILQPIAMSMLLSAVASSIIIFAVHGLGLYPYHR